MLGLNRRERPGYKWSQRNGEVKTFLVSYAGRLTVLPRNIPDNPADG
jgi:hypothetical protein